MSKEDFEIFPEIRKQKREKLEPTRMETAMTSISDLGYKTIQHSKSITFEFKGSIVSYFPYTGWATGKTIKDGRGLKSLLLQIKGHKSEK